MPLHHLGNVNHELDQRRSAIILCLATPSPSPGGIHDASRWTPESKTFQVRVDGRLRPGVSAKDIILALISRIGVGGGRGALEARFPPGEGAAYDSSVTMDAGALVLEEPPTKARVSTMQLFCDWRYDAAGQSQGRISF